MDWWVGLLVGLLQGVLEWLPVSSSGQSFLFLMGFFPVSIAEALRVGVFLHFGTLLAVLVKFRGDWFKIFVELFNRRLTGLTRFLVLASFVSLFFGGLIYLSVYEAIAALAGELASLLVGLLLVLSGFSLYVSHKRYGEKFTHDLGWFEALVVGWVQGLSVLPGISRSAVTVSSLLLSDLKPSEALKTSFLLSAPAVLGFISAEVFLHGLPADPDFLLSATLASFVTGYYSMEALMRFAEKMRFDLFCILFGLIIALASGLGLLI
ncbi:MAG: hypothetical protein GF334_08030 [Candidatus Altiarchaeales archaeon]|nr:hypothetical protein [Candidatus Altiarchaeales archaeon]